MSDDFSTPAQDIRYMQHALELASKAQYEGEVPVGAVVVLDDKVIGEGCNQPISSHDPTAHAEVVALRHAAKELGNYRLVDATLYVTLEPCIMCIGAIMHARIRRLVFGASDPKAGAIQSIYTIPEDKKLNHTIQVDSGILAKECGELLSNFFRRRREEHKKVKQ